MNASNNQTTQPLVSVIVPAYNAEDFIEKTLRSALAQTYSSLEIIVVDDDSTDSTVSLVRAMAQEDSRIILVQQSENQGVAAARNKAIEVSRGDYIAPLDADDIWHPQKIAKQVAIFLSASSEVGLVYTWPATIDENDFILSQVLNTKDKKHQLEGDVYYILTCSNFPMNPSCHLIRRECFDRCGYYDPGLRAMNAQGCEDWDICLRIAKQYHFRLVPEYLVGYREVPSSMSSNWRIMERSYNIVMASARKASPEIPACFSRWSQSFFYQYLFEKTLWAGHHKDALICLGKYIRADYLPLLNVRTYLHVLFCLLNIVTGPILSQLSLDPQQWMRARKTLPLSAQSSQRPPFSALDQVVNQRIISPYRWWRPDVAFRYWVLDNRWKKIISSSQNLAQQRRGRLHHQPLKSGV